MGPLVESHGGLGVNLHRHCRNEQVILVAMLDRIATPGEVTIVRSLAIAVEDWRRAVGRLTSLWLKRHHLAILTAPRGPADARVVCKLPIETAADVPKAGVAADGRGPMGDEARCIVGLQTQAAA